MKIPYVAIFNEPGDFDSFGIFVSEEDGERLIAHPTENHGYAALFDRDVSKVQKWTRCDILFSESEEPYAAIKKLDYPCPPMSLTLS